MFATWLCLTDGLEVGERDRRLVVCGNEIGLAVSKERSLVVRDVLQCE